LLLLPSLSSCIVLLPFIEEHHTESDIQNRNPQRIYSPSESIAGSAKAKRRSRKFDLYLRQLDDPKDTVRTSAASYLGFMGPGAEDAVPALIARLDDPSKFVRRAAAKALGRIRSGNPAAANGLKRASKDRDPYVAATAASALKQLQVLPSQTDASSLSPSGKSPMYILKK